MPKKYDMNFELNIKEEYVKGIKTNDIIKKYGCTSNYINTIRKKYNLKRHNLDYSDIIKFLNLEFSYTKKTSSGKNEKFYKCECGCGITSIIPSFVANKLYSKNKKYQCNKCSLSNETRYDRASKQIKRKDNTSGFIGVCINQYKGNILGYVSVINNKRNVIFKNKYKDPELHKKTLIQAAIDRDIFILEKSLPHRRNFTDLELFANMEYLAYDNINALKQILENKATS